MLKEIKIQNFAIIENIMVNFESGLNVILKETDFNIVFGGNKNELEILKTLNLTNSNRIFYSFNILSNSSNYFFSA